MDEATRQKRARRERGMQPEQMATLKGYLAEGLLEGTETVP